MSSNGSSGSTGNAPGALANVNVRLFSGFEASAGSGGAQQSPNAPAPTPGGSGNAGTGGAIAIFQNTGA